MDYSVNSLQVNHATGEPMVSGTANGQVYFALYTGSMEFSSMEMFSGNSARAGLQGMVSDDSGHVYLYGHTNADMDYFGKLVTNGIFLAKHDKEGDLVWVKQIPGAWARGDIGDQLVLSHDSKNVFLSGAFYNEIIIPGGTSLIPEDDENLFILKFGTDGTFSYATQVAGLDGKEVDLTVDYDGNLIVSEVFDDTLQIGSESFIPYGGGDVILMKLDAMGNNSWAKQSGGESADYLGITDVDSSNNIYFSGEFTSVNVTFGDSSRVLEDGDGNIMLAKLDPDGTIQWIKTHAGSASNSRAWLDGTCWPTDIKTLPDGHTYIKGWHGDSVNFSDILLTNKYGFYNYFIGKFNPDGKAIWVRSIEEQSYGFDYNQMALDNAGNVYFGAQAKDTIRFTDGHNDYSYVTSGAIDLFVASYSAQGDINWVKTMAGQTGYNNITAIAVTDTNRIYVGGDYNYYLAFGETEMYTSNFHGYFARLGMEPDLVIDNTFENYDRETNELGVYPNPVKDYLTIKLLKTENIHSVRVRIVSLQGKTVYSQQIAVRERTSIHVNDLQKGIYIIHVEAGDKKYYQKMIKK